jgi:outer membrane protein assembly factor BamB
MRHCLYSLLAVLMLAADWRQFRGSDSTGIADNATLPKSFAKDQNVAWAANLPGRGVSSPIVVGDRIFLTASSGPKQNRLHVLAFDASTGKQLWLRSFWATGPTTCHPKTCMAAPSPVCNGKHIIALFATNDLVCLDKDGNMRWLRSLYEENPGASDGRGLAASPLIVGDTLIIQSENQNNSFVAGIDLETGINRWRKEQSKEQTNWTSPIRLPGANEREALVLVQGSARLSALEPRTGREAWGLDCKPHPIASSVVAGNLLLVPGMEAGMAAYELNSAGPPRLLWESLKLNPDVASPLVLNNRVYALKSAVVAVGDLKTGEVVAQVRTKGPFSASPVCAGGVLYCFNEEGAASVIQPGDKEPTITAAGNMEETILATPAIAHNAMYVRSDKHLWKIADRKG